MSSTILLEIKGLIDKSQMAKDMSDIKSAIEAGASAIDKTFAAIKSNGVKSFVDIIQSAGRLADTLNSLSSKKDPFENMFSSLNQVNIEIQQIITNLEKLSKMKVAPNVTMISSSGASGAEGTGGGSGATKGQATILSAQAAVKQIKKDITAGNITSYQQAETELRGLIKDLPNYKEKYIKDSLRKIRTQMAESPTQMPQQLNRQGNLFGLKADLISQVEARNITQYQDFIKLRDELIASKKYTLPGGSNLTTGSKKLLDQIAQRYQLEGAPQKISLTSSQEEQRIRSIIQNRIKEWTPSGSYAAIKGLSNEFTGASGRAKMTPTTLLSQLKAAGLDLKSIAQLPEFGEITDKKSLEAMIANIAMRQMPLSNKLRTARDAFSAVPKTELNDIKARPADIEAEIKQMVKDRQYQRSRAGQDERILSGGAKNIHELRRLAKLQTPTGMSTEAFDKEIKSKMQGFGYSADQIKSFSQELHNTRANLLKTKGAVDSTGKSVNIFTQAWNEQWKAITRLGRYYVSFFFLSGIQQDFAVATQAAIKFKDQMLELKKFLPEGSPLGALQSSVLPMANEFAVPIDTVLGSYTEFAKQGKQANEIVDLTRSALLGVNVASIDYANVVTYLTTATNVWGYSTKETVGLIDKLAYVQAKSSAESTHLIASMQRTASMAKQFGLSLDDVLGYTAAISEKTMLPGEVIGTSMKTIIERSQRLKTLQELSKMDAFQGVQFINPLTGDMMRANEVLGLVAKSWATLNDEQRKSVGELIAGGRQVNTFIALMENYNRALQLSSDSSTSWGYAIKANETEMEKFSKTWTRFRSIVTEQMGGAIMTPFINSAKVVLDLFNSMSNGANFVGSAFGGLALSIMGGAGAYFAINKLTPAFVACTTAMSAATTGAMSLAAAWTALKAVSPAGWIGLIIGGVTATYQMYNAWVTSTQKQTEEQNALNKSLSETAKKLNDIANSKASADEKMKASVDIVKGMSDEQIAALTKEGARILINKQGQRYLPFEETRTQKALSTAEKGYNAISVEDRSSLLQIQKILTRDMFSKLPGGASPENVKDLINAIIQLRQVDLHGVQVRMARENKSIKDASLYDIAEYYNKIQAETKNVNDFYSKQMSQQLFDENRLPYKYTAKAPRTVLPDIPSGIFANIGEEVTIKFIQGLTDGSLNYLKENPQAIFSMIEDKFKGQTKQNAIQQQTEMAKAEVDAMSSYLKLIETDTTRSLRGTKVPKFKMDFDYTAIEVATKKLQELQSKQNEIALKMAEIKLNMDEAVASGKGKESTVQMQKEYDKLKEQLDDMPNSVTRAENALMILNSQLIMNSESASMAEKMIASLISQTLQGQNAFDSLGVAANALSSKFSGLNVWVQNVISSLLSIPNSISVQINAVFNAIAGSGMGQWLSNKVGGVLKSIAGGDWAKDFVNITSFNKRVDDLSNSLDTLTKKGKELKDNKKDYLGKSAFEEGMAKDRQELESLRKIVSSGTATKEQKDKYNALAGKLEEAEASIRKDAGAGAAKRDSEDKAHQAALEQIHDLEKRISVEKKIQSYWEGQLTDSFKRRWEREIGDLKDKSALYAELAKRPGLKPEEVRQYERQSREASAEAKMMEEKRADVEKIHQREMAQKKFNRSVEEANKLFEYQQQIRALDFEAGYTTEKEQQDLQMMQQEEKTKYAMAEYEKIYKNEKERTLEAIKEEQKIKGEMTAEVEQRVALELEEQLIMNETIQKAKERVIEEQRATVMLEKRLRNEILARAKQSVNEIQGTLANAIQGMFDNTAAEEKLKRIKEIMDEIAKLQQDSEFAGYNVAGAEATGSIDSINQAREKWYEVNQQMTEARKKLDEVNDSTNKWKEVLKNIGDVVLKKISERFAEMIMDKTGLGDMLFGMFAGIDGIGRGGATKASSESTMYAGIVPSLLGTPSSGGLSKAISNVLGNAPQINGFTGAVNPTTVIVNQSSGGGGINLGSMLGGQGGLNFGKSSTNVVASAAKTKSFGPINYLTAAMLGYGIGSSTSNRAVGVLGGAAAGFLTGGPVGAIIGGIASLFGKKKGDDTPPPVQPAREFYPLAKNTESLDRNTAALMKISESVFNAPSSFEMNKLQAEANAPKQVFNLNVNVSGNMSRAAATEVGNTILQTVSQGLAQSAPRVATNSTANWG